MRWWQNLQKYFRQYVLRRTPQIQPCFVAELPKQIIEHYLYIVGEAGWQWYAALLCPCGCKETLYLNLLPEQRPRWKVDIRADGAASLHPSVWRKVGCYSHFYLRHGEIEWVRITEGDPFIETAK